AVGEHQTKTCDLCRERSECWARSVRACANHTAERLAVDVAHVLQREARRMQQRADFPNRRRAAEGGHVALMIEGKKAVEGLQIDHCAVCRIEWREGMAG